MNRPQRESFVDKRIMFVDTETTGIPSDSSMSYRNIDNWPTIKQIAWLTYEKDDVLGTRHNYAISDEGGFSSKFLSDYTPKIIMPVHEILKLFQADLETCDVIVGHNIEYDINVILSELHRFGYDTSQLSSIQSFCTMKNSIEICGFDTRNGDRYPKLQELYSKLFHHPFENAHDAYCDAKATADCFWKMFTHGYLQYESYPFLLPYKDRLNLAQKIANEADAILNKEQQISLHEKAASLGYEYSMFRIGHIYYYDLHKANDAIDWYIKAINNGFMSPDCSYEYAELCKKLYGDNNFDALFFFKKWAKQCEEQFDTLSRQCILSYISSFVYGSYGQQKNSDKAIQLAKRALELNRPELGETPENDSIRWFIAWTLLKIGDSCGATEQFELYWHELKDKGYKQCRNYNWNITKTEEMLIKHYSEGIGVEVNYEKAIFYINELLSHDATNTIALQYLSKNEERLIKHYYEGIGVEVDYEKAIYYIDELLSHDATNAMALYYLGECYEKGLVTGEPDYNKAFDCFLKAESPEADKKVGIMLLEGRGCKRRKRLARDFLLRAKESGLDVSPYLEQAKSWF